ncbi:hypothetical protein ACWDUB_23165 [Streptomyces fungicidicus]
MSAAPTPVLPDECGTTDAARLATRHAGHFPAGRATGLPTDSSARPAPTRPTRSPSR